MKKTLTALAAVLALAACQKENTAPVGEGMETFDTVHFDFTPYQVEPMKNISSVSTVCSRLDIYVIDTAAGDTLRLHQERTATTGFGTATAVLQTNRSYRLVALAHNNTDTAHFDGAVFSFADDKVKQTLVADTLFSPGDGLQLQVVMKRIVGQFRLRVADTIPDEVASFRLTVDSAYSRWNVPLRHGVNLSRREHPISSMNRGSDGYVTFIINVIPDDLESVRTVRITAEALDAQGTAVETRTFEAVPIRAGYKTTYTGSFFITFDMGFTFGVGDWGELGETGY